MKLLVIILNKEEMLDEILEGFLELDIRATIIDSVGMARIVSNDIPIFAGLKQFMPGTRPSNKTIISVVKEELVQPAMKTVNQVSENFEGEGTGIMFTLPVDDVLLIKSAT